MTEEQTERLINALEQNTKASTNVASLIAFVLTKDKNGNDYIDQKVIMIEKKMHEQSDNIHSMLQPKIRVLIDFGENMENHSRNMNYLADYIANHIKVSNNFSESLNEHVQALKSHSETISEHSYELRNSRN